MDKPYPTTYHHRKKTKKARTQGYPHTGSVGSHTAADLVNRRGGVMRTGRTIIISAILALGATGSIMATTAMSATAAVHAPTVHVEALTPNTLYHA
jgi:hypothetical protein